jgi:glycosyltransferase involved in cell wall biosynthesis
MTRDVVVSVDQLARPQSGGIATYLRGLFAGFAELPESEGHDHRFVALAAGNGAVAGDLLKVPTRATHLDVRLLTRLWRFSSVGVPSTAAIVHATSMAGPFGGGRRDAVHSVLVHDVLWRDFSAGMQPRARQFHEDRLRLIARRSELRVLVTSEALASRVRDVGVTADRLRVVRLGVNASPVTVVPIAETLAKLGIADEAAEGAYTVVVGTVQPRRNLERLIQAHASARVRAPELGPLVVVGGWSKGWGDVDLRGARAVGEADDATLASLVAGARVCAYVPLAEGWGFPPVESMAAGRPTVASSTVPSVEGVDGVHVVDPTDADAIREGLLAAVADDDDEAARQRRRNAVSHLSWTQCARDHLAAWS